MTRVNRCHQLLLFPLGAFEGPGRLASGGANSFEKVMHVEGHTISMNPLLVEMIHGFLGACCHQLKTTALGHEVLG